MSSLPIDSGLGGSSHSVRNALLWQLGTGLVAMLVVALYYDVQVALGIGFGVLIVMLSTILLGRRIHEAADTDPESGQRILYAGAGMRFVLVIIALLVAFGLGLHLLAVAVGMVLAQAAMFVFAVSGLRDQFKRPD